MGKFSFWLWAVVSKVGLYLCTPIFTDIQGGGKINSFISHWGPPWISPSHSHSFTFSYPLIYLSTLSVYTSLIRLSLVLLSLSLCLFPLFFCWSVSLPFWSFLVFDLPWAVFLSSWPAGMRGSYQTSQMVEFFLIRKSWTWNNTLAKLMTVAADMSLVANKFTTTLSTASQKLELAPFCV